MHPGANPPPRRTSPDASFAALAVPRTSRAVQSWSVCAGFCAYTPAAGGGLAAALPMDLMRIAWTNVDSTATRIVVGVSCPRQAQEQAAFSDGLVDAAPVPTPALPDVKPRSLTVIATERCRSTRTQSPRWGVRVGLGCYSSGLLLSERAESGLCVPPPP